MNYLFFTNNSVIVIFYIGICPGCYLLFIYLILIPYSKFISPFLLIFGNLVVLLGFWLYYKAYSTNPGIITQKNLHFYEKKYEKYIDE